MPAAAKKPVSRKPSSKAAPAKKAPAKTARKPSGTAAKGKAPAKKVPPEKTLDSDDDVELTEGVAKTLPVRTEAPKRAARDVYVANGAVDMNLFTGI
ncbi:hypothetical protein B0H21DRAFT_820008 [Amylocystis lapponica]|nr:hypothetical protein B0H21DRAFT_820008 [Amylocystis lapponica]